MNKKNLLSYFNNASSKDWKDWRWQMNNRVRKTETLHQLFGKNLPDKDNLNKLNSIYPVNVSPYYLSLINDNVFEDPVGIQCLPQAQEITAFQEYPHDPLEEENHMPSPKIINRYPDRCLALVTENCATYCRHCNRKRLWAQPAGINFKKRLQHIARYLGASEQIREVIISGGDPLIYDDDKIEMILACFKAIPHVEILRIGSRSPVVMPMRITRKLCRLLKRYRPLWFNTQFNHASEITPDAARACNMLLETGIPVSNQSVLLKGVNDSPQAMRDLLFGLQKISVRPYYLFHCEPARGCGHFRTDMKSSIKLMQDIRRECSGLALPQYVADMPGDLGKIPLLALAEQPKDSLSKHQYFFDNFD
ncbi:MAG TPA: KamA family radical SAM protein [Deltaproteobacteria bacterium]|nr:KamA family radical SAM protein [Deltaproteobacteria bacterium]